MLRAQAAVLRLQAPVLRLQAPELGLERPDLPRALGGAPFQHGEPGLERLPLRGQPAGELLLLGEPRGEGRRLRGFRGGDRRPRAPQLLDHGAVRQLDEGLPLEHGRLAAAQDQVVGHAFGALGHHGRVHLEGQLLGLRAHPAQGEAEERRLRQDAHAREALLELGHEAFVARRCRGRRLTSQATERGVGRVGQAGDEEAARPEHPLDLQEQPVVEALAQLEGRHRVEGGGRRVEPPAVEGAEGQPGAGPGLQRGLERGRLAVQAQHGGGAPRQQEGGALAIGAAELQHALALEQGFEERVARQDVAPGSGRRVVAHGPLPPASGWKGVIVPASRGSGQDPTEFCTPSGRRRGSRAAPAGGIDSRRPAFL